MSTNLEYKERERQRKRERRRQASEAQPEKGRQRYRARHNLKKETFFLLVAAVTKCERPTIKYKVKMSGGEKK